MNSAPLRFAAALTLVLAAFASQAIAADVDPLAAFYGEWGGSALSGDKDKQKFTEMRLSVRDSTVSIEAMDSGGFRLEWGTVLRQKGDPTNPTEELKTTTRVFEASGRPNLWTSSDNGDPMKGEPYSWAGMDGATLVVYSIGVLDNGALELQIYRRTIEGKREMRLEFSRSVNGVTKRTAKGRLQKAPG